ncbi:hypothetical protein BS78_K007000 [Paspalum vaginatum]|uniref:DUF4216 domain-containing protein n=1 Tax=Paspalum vaginatum TaxID=158149 RepID=A0A9W7XDH6_9POAL|nr:hypothetical protein BS78_K007000 [Paspalum vaginatum]
MEFHYEIEVPLYLDILTFESNINELHAQGKVSDNLYDLSRGPDPRVRVYNRCFINGFLFRTQHIENKLSTRNSGVVVKGDESTRHIDWYGVVKRIISLDFPNGKEVVLFLCDWFDVPAADRNKGRGFKKDNYGIIDIDTTWLRMKPGNLFAMPDKADIIPEAEIDVDSLDVRVQDMNVASRHEDMSNWRSDMDGVSGDVTLIQKAHEESKDEEPCDLELEDDDDDDTYIDDGHVAPVQSVDPGSDDEFFV